MQPNNALHSDAPRPAGSGCFLVRFAHSAPVSAGVGRSGGKAHECSWRSQPSASFSREALVCRSASGGSVPGADAAAWLAGVLVLWPIAKGACDGKPSAGFLPGGLVAFPVSSGYALCYSPNPALQATRRMKPRPSPELTR